MTGRRGHRRTRNLASAIFPGINSAPYQSLNHYPYPQYVSGTGGGYPTGGTTGGIFGFFGSYRSAEPSINIVVCNGFKLVGNMGYLLLKNSIDSELVQIDNGGMYKYHFMSGDKYDLDEDGALIILDEGSL